MDSSWQNVGDGYPDLNKNRYPFGTVRPMQLV